MKKILLFYSLLLIMFSALSACKKSADKPGGGNPPADTAGTRKFQLVIDSLPGETTGLDELSAIISIVNTQNDTIVANRKIALKFNGK